MRKIIIIPIMLIGCGYPSPAKLPNNEWELYYCENEKDCFDAAEETCKEGYIVTKWENKPKRFKCK